MQSAPSGWRLLCGDHLTLDRRECLSNLTDSHRVDHRPVSLLPIFQITQRVRKRRWRVVQFFQVQRINSRGTAERGVGSRLSERFGYRTIATPATSPGKAGIPAGSDVASRLRQSATLVPAAPGSPMMSHPVAPGLRQKKPPNSATVEAGSQLSQMSQRLASEAWGEPEEDPIVLASRPVLLHDGRRLHRFQAQSIPTSVPGHAMQRRCTTKHAGTVRYSSPMVTSCSSSSDGSARCRWKRYGRSRALRARSLPTCAARRVPGVPRRNVDCTMSKLACR